MNLQLVLCMIAPWLKLPPEVLPALRAGSTVMTGLAVLAALSAVNWRGWIGLYFLFMGLFYAQICLWTESWPW
jgi:hypothetical protein